MDDIIGNLTRRVRNLEAELQVQILIKFMTRWFKTNTVSCTRLGFLVHQLSQGVMLRRKNEENLRDNGQICQIEKILLKNFPF